MIYQDQRYDWRPGSRIPGIDAQVAGERLAALAQQYGRVTPDLVVNDARAEDAPLHAAFTWDDGDAAEKYRRWEARQLIASVVVYAVVESSPTPVKSTRAFVNLEEPTTHDRMYLPVAAVLSDSKRRRILLAQAYKDYKAWETKYHDLAELAEIFTTAERVLSAIIAESAEEEAAA